MKNQFWNATLDSEMLLCPRCGGHNLHQGAVKIVTRDIEDGPGQVVSADHGKVAVRQVEEDDLQLQPTRRDYLEITFTCESCMPFGNPGEPPPIHLRITQHKGLTLVSWHESVTSELEAEMYVAATERTARRNEHMEQLRFALDHPEGGLLDPETNEPFTSIDDLVMNFCHDRDPECIAALYAEAAPRLPHMHRKFDS